MAEGSKLAATGWALLACLGGGLIYGGIALMRTTETCRWDGSQTVCTSNPYGIWGLPETFLGIGLLLFGIGSFAKSWGGWRPYAAPKYGTRDLQNFDPALTARAERRAHWILLALLAATMVVVEAVPIDALYQQTANAAKPTFNPVAFTLDLVVFAVADLLVLLLVYVYIARR